MSSRSLATDTLAASLLSKMTPDEKVSMIRGIEEPAPHNDGEAGYLAGVPRLGIPPLRLADGPPGLLLREPSVAEVATMGVAATFDVELARQNGMVIADEARRLNIDVVLQPFINIDRDIAFSRGYNTFGEDPLLTATIGAAEIVGIQSRGVLAEAKHFVAYDTDGQSVSVDEQPLHEIYLAPFDAAIQAGVASIMCSYNKVGGQYACGNDTTLTRILRDQLGFRGFVVSDWGAVHDNLGLAAGLDVEMPGRLTPGNPFAGILPSYYDDTPPPHHVPAPDFGQMRTIFEGTIPEEPQPAPVKWSELFPVDTHFRNLFDALREGNVSTAEVDLAAGHVLREMILFGRVPGAPAPVWPQRLSQAAIDAVDQRTSEESTVLLKNAHNTLPLTLDDLRNLAIIGPGGRQVIAVGKPSERSLGEVAGQISPADALRTLAGPAGGIVTAVADEMDGHPIQAAALDGLTRSIGNDAMAPASDLVAAGGASLPSGRFVRWSGTLRITKPGQYWLALHILGARADIAIDGRRIGGTHALAGGLHGDIVQPNQDSLLASTNGLDNVRVTADLSVGSHQLNVSIRPDGSGAVERARLAWSTPDDRAADRAAAVAVARHARKVVLFLWSRGQPVFGLPGDQDQLARDVLAANPNTVVVLNTSQPVALPWLGQAAALLQMWWSGDRGGAAAAAVLTGAVDPGGRLPFTWAGCLADYPATDPTHPERSNTGSGGRTTFSEGGDVGYRWFLRQQIHPLFPFGFGLSYTRFDYADLGIEHTANGGLDVKFNLTDTGDRDGDEVPQIYLGAPASPDPGAAFPVRRLAAFARLHLRAGERRAVTLHVAPRELEYWSTVTHSWKQPVGSRPLLVGTSAIDVQLSGKT